VGCPHLRNLASLRERVVEWGLSPYDPCPLTGREKNAQYLRPRLFNKRKNKVSRELYQKPRAFQQ
jgi:hypothetical protein